MANADELFKALIAYMEVEGLDFYKKFTVGEICEILDKCRDKGKVKIESESSYNYAITSMFSNQRIQNQTECRDYFDFVDEVKSKELTELAKDSNRNNHKWKEYKDIELYITKKHINNIVNNIGKAGDNEKDFINFVMQNSDIELKGKKVFGDREGVNISVDNYFELDGKNVYVEIDSGNMAKLLVGQYVLLNSLKQYDNNDIFLIIHYYKNYNDKRTKKNLKHITENLKHSTENSKEWMNFVAMHIDEFKRDFSVDKLKKELNRNEK